MPRKTSARASIKIFLTESEVRNADCEKLIHLFSGRSDRGLRLLQATVTLILPRRFRTTFECQSFEHREFRAFASSLNARFPGFSFFVDIRGSNTFKQLLMATMESIRLLRKGTKVTISFSEAKWAIAVDREIKAAREFAEKAKLPASEVSALAASIASYLQSPSFR